MNPNFEIKYLEVTWYSKETLTKVTESMNALSIEYDQGRGIFHTETTTYPKLQNIQKGQIAIRFFDKNIDKPYIEMPNGERSYFNPIKDPNTGFIWWIIQDKWVEKDKLWYGIAPNIVGQIQLYLHNQRCEICISGSDFSYDQLEQYLRTFKNDLWELILDENSIAKAKAKESRVIAVNNDIVECIKNLVIHAEKILKKPKTELREIQDLKLRKAVKPVNRTFMELATKTNQRFLTSRATKPSYNVAENRYILFALERCYRILKQIVHLSDHKAKRYEVIAKKLQAQHDAFTNIVKVNRDIVVADLEKIRERTQLSFWQKQIDNNLALSGMNLHETPCNNDLYLKLENHTKNQETSEPDGFFFLLWDGKQWSKPENKSGILSLRNGFSELVNILEPGMSLKINGDFICRSNPKSVLLHLERIYSIELIDSHSIQKALAIFKKEKEEGIKLAENNWYKLLSNNEIEEQEKEKQALNNRINFYQNNKKQSSKVYKEVEPKFRLLKTLITELRRLGITPASHFPNSMTFVQNPHYQGVHNGYKILRDTTNLSDEDLLLSLEQIDAIGLVNMPLLYERWVLIQIILILKGIFRFNPQDDWKYKLIEAVKTNQTDISIHLTNHDAKRYITLWYEKTLPNRKRPDFILDLTWYEESDVRNESPFHQRFVLDAKFYDKSTFAKAGGMMSKLDELYIDKNYSENAQNPVFLIHPCKNIIQHQITPQTWGQHSFLGELDLSDNKHFSHHNKGAIFLNPIDNALYSDELQRLLGLFLQYKLESSSTKDLDDDKTKAVPICIRCGSTEIKQLEKTASYMRDGRLVKRTTKSVWMQCVECKQFQSYNHCSNKQDQNTRLIKNGLYWSYHSARALEPYNIKCPSCGQWGAW